MSLVTVRTKQLGPVSSLAYSRHGFLIFQLAFLSVLTDISTIREKLWNRF